jgi:hypothetical protein
MYMIEFQTEFRTRVHDKFNQYSSSFMIMVTYVMSIIIWI